MISSFIAWAAASQNLSQLLTELITTPTSLSLNTFVEIPVTGEITLINTNTVPVTILDLAITGTNAGDFSAIALPSTIPAAKSTLWTGAGSAALAGSGATANNNNGGAASGFGCGGGGAGFYGGNGGAGLYGGGGGGAAGFTGTQTGGTGGKGAVVVELVANSETTHILLTTGTTYITPAQTTSVKIWTIGAGGGGAGSPANDSTSGGAGGAGGTSYKTWTGDLGGQQISYSIGAAGSAGIGASNGSDGNSTTVTFQSTTITAFGGQGGRYNVNTNAVGGSYSGGDGGAVGGQGGYASGDKGGASGGAIGNISGLNSTSSGGNTGAQSADIDGLQAAVLDALLASSITVTATSSTTGNKSAFLAISHNAAGSPINVDLTSTVLEAAPAISLSTNEVTIANAAVGSSATSNITVTNTGIAPLTISSLTLFSSAAAANVSLLLNMNGSNGSTTFTDAANLNTITAVGGAQISTAQSKFGGASGYFDGSGDYLTIPSSNNFAFGTGDFTVECWFYAPSSVLSDNIYRPIIAIGNASNAIIISKYRSGVSNNFYAGYLYNNNWQVFFNPTTTTIPTNTWAHVALVRSGNTFTLYVNGSSIAAGTYSGSTALPTYATAIGHSWQAGEFWNGYIDDVRITNGVAQYTANFTPPTEQFGVISTDFTVSGCTSSVAPGATCPLTVTFTPTTAGSKSAILSVTHNATGSPSNVIVSSTAFETAPAISLSTNEVTIANTNINSTTTSTITISNTGTAPLTVSNLAVSGTDVADFTVSGCSDSLAAGGSCTLTVTFTPTTAGSKSATLSVTHNATGSPSVIALSGTAIVSTASKLLFTWGEGGSGQLGDGTRTDKSSPVQVGTSSWSSVSSGRDHSLAIRADGTLWAWGNGGNGQLGNGTLVSRSSPVQVGTSSWSSVSAGALHSLAIRADGTLWAWGIGISGELGNGDGGISAPDRPSPVQIGTSSWSSVSASNGISLAIRADGTLWAWGNNSAGQLGDGTRITRSSPVQIGTSSWSSVSTNRFHALAIRADGTLWAWGTGTAGQLGNGTRTNMSSPVQVGTSSWSSVSAGALHSLAIRADGTLWAWGSNSVGEIGDGTLVSRSSPVQIGTSSWSSVSATGSSSDSAAIRADGTLWAWGNNSAGQLGDGTIITRSSPVQIGTSSWSSVSAGTSYKVALKST